MDKSLKIIQTLSKIAKVICQILFIFLIIGGAGCLLGILSLGLVQGLQMDEEILQYIGEFELPLDMPTLYFSCVVGVLACIGECIVVKFFQKYLENELKAGTPFTFEGAKELLKIGIISIVVSVIGSVLMGTTYGIFSTLNPSMVEFNYEFGFDIGTGLAMMFFSVIFKYGAQVLAEKNAACAQAQQSLEDTVEQKENLSSPSEEDK